MDILDGLPVYDLQGVSTIHCNNTQEFTCQTNAIQRFQRRVCFNVCKLVGLLVCVCGCACLFLLDFWEREGEGEGGRERERERADWLSFGNTDGFMD